MSWNFKTSHVQEDFHNGQFASAESTLVAAGPPQLSSLSTNGGAKTDDVYGIGLLENIGIQQSKQLQRIFEIGSSRSYFIPGRVIGSVNLGRVFYYGPSLLKVIYAYYNNLTNGVELGTEDPGTIVAEGTANEATSSKAALLDGTSPDSTADLFVSPGSDHFYINLASDMFNQGTGLAVYFKDSNFNLIGAMYMEDCYVQGHQMNVASGSVLLMEGASMQFDRVVPIQVQTE